MTPGGSVAVVVLAAGSSRRLGHPKQLVECDGRSLLRKVVDEARGSRCDRVAVVLGADSERVRTAALSDVEGERVVVLRNPNWAEGIASSIRSGVAWAEREGRGAVVLAVGDQPALSAAHIDCLLKAHAAGALLAASRYQGTLGVPALFARSYFAALLALRGDEGARGIVRAAAEVSAVEWEPGAFDIDLASDVAALKSRARI